MLTRGYGLRLVFTTRERRTFTSRLAGIEVWSRRHNTMYMGQDDHQERWWWWRRLDSCGAQEKFYRQEERTWWSNSHISDDPGKRESVDDDVWIETAVAAEAEWRRVKVDSSSPSTAVRLLNLNFWDSFTRERRSVLCLLWMAVNVNECVAACRCCRMYFSAQALSLFQSDPAAGVCSFQIQKETDDAG